MTKTESGNSKHDGLVVKLGRLYLVKLKQPNNKDWSGASYTECKGLLRSRGKQNDSINTFQNSENSQSSMYEYVFH